MALEKRGEFSINIIIMILMAFFMVWIIFFGISKLGFLSSNLSETEIINYKNKVKEFVNYCDDPMNKGDTHVEVIEHDKIDIICFLGNDYNSYFSFSNNLNTIKSIYEGGDNVFFAKAKKIVKNGGNYQIKDIYILNSFYLKNYNQKTSCFTVNNNSHKIVLKITCK